MRSIGYGWGCLNRHRRNSRDFPPPPRFARRPPPHPPSPEGGLRRTRAGEVRKTTTCASLHKNPQILSTPRKRAANRQRMVGAHRKTSVHAPPTFCEEHGPNRSRDLFHP